MRRGEPLLSLGRAPGEPGFPALDQLVPHRLGLLRRRRPASRF